MEDIDILQIHQDIITEFEEKVKKLPAFEKMLEEIESRLSDASLSYRIRHKEEVEWEKLKEQIEDIKTGSSYNFYVIETLPIVEKYCKIIKNPIKISFMGKREDKNYEKLSIIQRFISIASKYSNISITLKNIKRKMLCTNCSNSLQFDIIDNYYICIECGKQLYNVNNFSSYSAINRINITGKYTYDRKVHFRDCLNQFQGKQNATINQKVYDDLIRQFDLHGLLIDSKDSKIRFSRITKKHIQIFLKETGHTKHYEDHVLIHFTITNKKPPDISYLEARLLEDFDILTNIYDKKYRKNSTINRKNFINTQYVLYQLLRKYKYPCDKLEFNILKTVERKAFHDDICKDLFDELGWNFNALF